MPERDTRRVADSSGVMSMDADSQRSVYDSPRMADGYAFDRPPVHPHIIKAVASRLAHRAPVGRALDVGCGAGASTAALEPVARHAVGLEPVRRMLAHRRTVAPRASFVVAGAEHLPFQAGAFDLVTAAGSLNYVDLRLFLPELSRVLAPGGVTAVYDFSAGRRFQGDPALDRWYARFAERYPPKPGYDLDVSAIEYGPHGLRLDAYEQFDIAVPMSLYGYVRYVMSETGVELAIERGVAEWEIRGWCESTLEGVFGSVTRDVLFEAYVAYVVRG